VKSKELLKLSHERLIKLKKELELNLIKASSSWGREKTKNKEAGINTKGIAKQGQKTTIQRQIRRTIAQVNTEIRRREIEDEKKKETN